MRLFHAIFILLSALALTGCRDSDAADTRRALYTLDALVADGSAHYDEAKAHADSLGAVAIRLSGTPAEAQARLEAADAFADLDTRLALQHTLEALRCTSDPGADTDTRQRVLIRLASLYNSQGYMTKEAFEIYSSLSPHSMSGASLERYYVLGVQLYNTLARNSIDAPLSRRYAALAAAYRDSVLRLSPDRRSIAANRLLAAGDPEGAERLLLSHLPAQGSAEVQDASLCYNLAQVYIGMERWEEAEHYLTLAAISDLSRGSRNYRALPALAAMLHRRGDTERGYRYIHRASSDAAASHATKRQIEMASDLAAIDAAYAAHRGRRNLIFWCVGAAVALVAAVALAAFVMLRRKNRQLNENAEGLRQANSSLSEAYEEMESLNARLASESRVKQKYITSFMNLCLSYLRKMERFRAELAKTAAKGNLEAVTKAINSSRYVNREIAEFYTNFDEAFLSLYPGFVAALNSLLRPEEHYPEELTAFSTDLRIYALVWLGIHESGEIASFLRCSESTVYNYRTQMRNRALRRDSFESDISALSALENHSAASTFPHRTTL